MFAVTQERYVEFILVCLWLSDILGFSLMLILTAAFVTLT